MLQQKLVDTICTKIAELLRAAREARGLSMNAVAERAGLSQQMVSYVERGMRKPTIDTLIRIAFALEIDLSDLIRRAHRVTAKER